jgi:hypothetical protein
MEDPMTDLYNENAPAYSGGRAGSTLTAFFDSRGDAEQAIDRLTEAGVSQVRLMPGYESDDEKAEVSSDDRVGFWARLEDWLFPVEDRAVYAEGLRRGGFLVSATVDDATYEIAHDILDEHGAIHMDERAAQWRSDGWNAPTTTDALSTRAYGPSIQKREFEDHDRSAQAAKLQEDAFEAEAAARDSFPIDGELRDDVLPTGHQRTVEDEADPAIRETRQSQDMDSMRQEQIFPRGR